MDLTKFYVYDIETYKEVFTVSVIRADGKHKNTFVCSKWQNDIERIFKFMDFCRENDCFAVGFNSLGFDYSVLHDVLELRNKNKVPKTGLGIAHKVFEFAQKQIDSFKDDGFGRTIKIDERYFKQIDLYKVHHMNNKAKRTSLKMLEFVMQMDNIEELPFDIEAELSEQDIKKLVAYNEHDVSATLRFFLASLSQVQFRLDLGEKLGKDFSNADDTKIGSEFFEMRLEEAGVKLYRFQDGRRVLNQTKRNKIKVKDCLVDYYVFHHPEFQAVYNWFGKQVITETKGVFSDIEEHELGELAQYAELTTKRKKFKSKPDENELRAFYEEHPMGWVEEEELKATEYAFDENGEHLWEFVLDEDGCPDLSKKPKKKRIPKKSYYGCWRIAETLNTVVNGYRIDFGVGGVHASISEKISRENHRYMIRDADVSSMYPNISISNRLHPEHLTEKFCDIYKSLYEERKSYPKGSAENSMLKLALNSCYGKSNDKFSVFYDPKFTMSITINGQLSLLMLADRLLQIEGLKLIQLNTDGITVALLRETEEQYNTVCKQWEKDVGLELEFADYSKRIS